MQDANRIKKVLAEVLRDKEDNLIKLYFDWHFRYTGHPNLEEEIKRLQSELDVARIPKEKSTQDKERILVLEKRLEELKKVSNEIAFIGETIENAKKLIEELKNCINHPEKVLEYEEYKKKISRKRG